MQELAGYGFVRSHRTALMTGAAAIMIVRPFLKSAMVSDAWQVDRVWVGVVKVGQESVGYWGLYYAFARC